jgi:hypothetical protein
MSELLGKEVKFFFRFGVRAKGEIIKSFWAIKIFMLEKARR